MAGRIIFDRHGVQIEDNGANIWFVIDGEARMGLWIGNADCDDPTLVICNDEEHGGEGILVVHPGQVDFAQEPDAARAALLAHITKDD